MIPNQSLRESPQHAGALGAVAAVSGAIASYVVLSGLGVGVRNAPFGFSARDLVGSPTLFAGAIVLSVSALIGYVEGALAQRFADGEADRFTPVGAVARSLLTSLGIANAVIAAVLVVATMTSPVIVIHALLSSVLIAAMTLVGVGVLLWSYATDWPTPPPRIRPVSRTPFADSADDSFDEPDRVFGAPPGRRQ